MLRNPDKLLAMMDELADPWDGDVNASKLEVTEFKTDQLDHMYGDLVTHILQGETGYRDSITEAREILMIDFPSLDPSEKDLESYPLVTPKNHLKKSMRRQPY